MNKQGIKSNIHNEDIVTTVMKTWKHGLSCTSAHTKVTMMMHENIQDSRVIGQGQNSYLPGKSK